jgi:MFS family permease
MAVVIQDPPAGNKWLVLVTSSLGALLGSLMFTAINVALPSLSRTFETDFNVVQWVVLSFLLATVTLVPIVGRWADMVGKKRLFILGYGVFTL